MAKDKQQSLRAVSGGRMDMTMKHKQKLAMKFALNARAAEQIVLQLEDEHIASPFEDGHGYRITRCP